MFAVPSLVCGLALVAYASAQITLGTAAAYGVFAATTITNTGSTVVNGLIGLSPGTAVTGFPPGLDSGEDLNDGAATTAKTDLQSAYGALAALPVNTDLTGQNLGGLTLTSGVYGFSSSGSLTGTLTLDAQGDPNALFVFKFGSTLITASAASVLLINGAQACNLYWQVGSSATLGTGTAFLGNILAHVSITATTSVTLNGGGLYALTAAVSLDTNTIDPVGSCGGVVDTITTSSTTLTASPTTTALTASSTAISNSFQTISSASTTSTSTKSKSSTSSLTTVSAITMPKTSKTSTSPISSATTDVTVTWISTSTVPVASSTTWITTGNTGKCTSTRTVATSTSSCTSTAWHTSTYTKITTCAIPTCASSAKTSSASKGKRDRLTTTTTKVSTSYCAGKTSTFTTGASDTITKLVTQTAIYTHWLTSTSTSTSTSTYTPSCTPSSVARRDYQRMFG